MKHTALITIAAATLAFTSAPTFAQSSYGGNTGDSYGNTSAKATKAERKARKAEEKRIKAAQMVEDEKAKMMAQDAAMKEKAMMENTMKDQSSATDASMMKDDAMKDHSSATDASMMKKDEMKDHSSATGSMMKTDGEAMMKKEDVMMESTSMKPVNCPTGTTPQDNGTCMLN